YSGVIISGMLGGIGGMMLIIATVGTYGGTVNGYGFLAIAVMIFGQWKPINIFFAALFFAAMNALSSWNMAIPFLEVLKIPTAIYRMLPYVATLVVLAFTSKKSRAPKAEGIP
ncbi:MAG: ABC transporter permease, partial [Clostridia bacterium]